MMSDDGATCWGAWVRAMGAGVYGVYGRNHVVTFFFLFQVTINNVISISCNPFCYELRHIVGSKIRAVRSISIV